MIIYLILSLIARYSNQPIKTSFENYLYAQYILYHIDQLDHKEFKVREKSTEKLWAEEWKNWKQYIPGDLSPEQVARIKLMSGQDLGKYPIIKVDWYE